MRSPLVPLVLSLGLSAVSPAQDAAPIDFARLVAETADLQRLTRLPDPAYRNLQWSSFDRRAENGPDSPGWFGNADGFGSEPVPGFAATLREPDEDGRGQWLLGEHRGPGAIVRTWTAGMGGVLRVYLDGAEEPLYEGPAADFLARRSLILGGGEVAAEDPIAAFQMEDADHLPIPFAESLRMTWEGTLRQLHFYHVQIRDYADGANLRTFRLDDLRTERAAIEAAAARLREPERIVPDEGTTRTVSVVNVPARDRVGFDLETAGEGGTQLVRLALRVLDAPDVDAALRGIVLRLAFDGTGRPQVETPLGDFCGSGPGINPFVSLPFTMRPDGTLICRFPMPYAESARLTLEDYTGHPASVRVEHVVAPYTWDDASLHFRARWRNDRALDSGGRERPIDLPYLMLRGQGRLVGVACMVMNPSGVPTPGGNWWGEGDEKVFVDDDELPSIFGTGSEDYYDYSWSRPRLFAHPYCGQPLDSGPGTAGFISNHRFQIVDDVPFERLLWFAMELYTHRPVQRMDYARVAWCYARPGAIDDHVPPTLYDVELPELPVRAPVAGGGARGATLVDAWELSPTLNGRPVDTVSEPLATRHRVVGAELDAGDVLRLAVDIPEAGAWDVNVVAAHRPDGAVVQPWLGGEQLAVDGDAEPLDLRNEHVTRILSRRLVTGPQEARRTALELRCVEPGFVGLDYLWLKLRHRVVPGMLEGEAMRVVDHAEGVTWEDQGLRGGRWSAGRHLWVKAQDVGDHVVLEAEPPAAGRYRARLVLTQSYDYAALRVGLQGRMVAERVNTYDPDLAVMEPLDCGEVELADGDVLRLRLEVVGRPEGSGAPGTYFGVDGVILERL